MKKTLFFLGLFSVLVSCKNDAKPQVEEFVNSAETSERTAKQSDGLIMMNGNFIYYDGAAVLQTPNDMYLVINDEKMLELNEQVKPYKKLDTDMVPVTIRGKVTPKPENEEGWAYRVEIKEIVTIKAPSPEDNDVIKLGN